MSLSPSDQEIFDQLESQFKGDKTFKSKARRTPKSKTATVIVVGIILIVVGIMALIVGVAVAQMLLGLLGFAIMFTGALFLSNRFIDSTNNNVRYGRR